ncbi:MAG: phosphatidylglycerophosphatase A [Phycisphaerae bacterium]
MRCGVRSADVDDRGRTLIGRCRLESKEPRNTYQRALLLIGSIGPIGHLPASGTLAVAVCGVPLFCAMASWPAWAYVVATVSLTAGSIALHDWGDRMLGTHDTRTLVWDELVGFMIAVAFVPFTWRLAIAAVIVERVLDIVKVPPAHWIERRWPGGWGVVGDDVVAGVYTCGLLHVAIHFGPWFMPG